MRKIYLAILLILVAGTALAYQATIVVPNGTGAQVRTATNNALQATTTHQSAPTAPAITYPFQLWADTTSSPSNTVLKIRNWANSGWLTVCYISDSGGITFPGSITSATYATSAGSANTATTAGSATTATTATNATYATSAGSATTATNASYATTAGALSGQRIMYGSVAANGTVVRGSGFTVSHTGPGRYQINFTTPWSSMYSMSVTRTAASSTPDMVFNSVVENSNSNALVGFNTLGMTQAFWPGTFYLTTGTGLTSTPVDSSFSFVAIGSN